MKKCLDSEMLFQGVCLAFEGMATASPRVVDAFAVKGGLAALFEGMPRFIDTVSVQLCATMAISTCISMIDKTDFVEDAIQSIPNAARPIVMAMNKHPSCGNLQLVGCILLNELVSLTPDEAVNIVRSGGLLVLTSSMRNFPLETNLQDNAICLLRKLTVTGIMAKVEGIEMPVDLNKSIEASGAIPSILYALECLDDEPKIVLAGIVCLLTMFMSDDNVSVSRSRFYVVEESRFFLLFTRISKKTS